MQAVIPMMRAQGGGSIVNIKSGTAFMTILQYSVYSASKRALLGFSLTARAELEKDGIVVSEIYPFITTTNFGKNRMGNPAGGGPSAHYAECNGLRGKTVRRSDVSDHFEQGRGSGP
jgi:short-subunit dehydrogenase